MAPITTNHNSQIVTLISLGSLFVAISIVFCLANTTSAYSIVDQATGSGERVLSNDLVSLALIENPKQVAYVLEGLLKSIVLSTNDASRKSLQKRGLDLGMTRGFSGSQAGKHLMGLSAANFAGGPGK